jgi:transcription elongation GreA/GreB family factor
MNVEQVKNWIGAGAYPPAEAAWMKAVEEGGVQPDEAGDVLAAFVAAGRAETAETLGWALLEQAETLEPQTALELAKVALLAVPDSRELRRQTAELYKKACAGRENFEAFFAASGLDADQSPKRALRTLETCLAVRPGSLLANRFDGRVIRIQGFTSLGEFEFLDEGRTHTLEPKLLADEFDLLPPDDFRVLRYTDPEALRRMFQKDLAGVLVGLCLAHGGRISSEQLHDAVVPEFVPAEGWSGWWSRARNAAKKQPQLALTGRSPVVIEYHPVGRTLEEDFAAALKAAYHPLDFLNVLRSYVREAAARRATVSDEFVRDAMDRIVRRGRCGRPQEALEAALALSAAAGLGLNVQADVPGAAEVLAGANDPVEMVTALNDESLWPAALEAMKARPDAAEQLERLLYRAPLSRLDGIAAELAALDRPQAIARVVAEALSEPIQHLTLCAWTWAGCGGCVPDLPPRTTILCKLLDALFDIDHHWTGDASGRKPARQLLRAALADKDYAVFRATLDEMDASLAAVVKGKIERTDGLAQTVRDGLLQILRAKHYQLFVKPKVQPWDDETVLWTTQASLHAREEELRVLQDVKMPANARQIGEAAEQGDLRENAGWQAAIEERDMLVARARKLQEELLKARILHHDDVPADHVGVGSRVRLRRTDDNQQVELSFLGPWDSDPEKRVFAYTSRLAQNLMGKPIGATLSLEIDGNEAEYAIEALSAAL